MAEWIAVFLDFYICVILTVEYFWGRSDADIRNEAKKKARTRKERHLFDELNIGEHK